MLRTFTLNPAIDVSLSVPELLPIHKNRASSVTREAGGGGVNVARVLVRLGAEVECVVAAGGATGSELLETLHGLDVAITELEVRGATRESLQIHDVQHGLNYRIGLDGPELCDSVEQIGERIRAGRVADVEVFSGSLPLHCPPTTYRDLSLVHPSSFSIVDTSGDALAGSLGGEIDLIKPSLRELEHLLDATIADAAELHDSAQTLLAAHGRLGAILTSLGDAGAVLSRLDERSLHLSGPDVEVVSAVGAGDSLVAGVAWGISRGEDLLTACRLGVAAGTATVATPGTSLCSAVSVLELFGQVEVTELRGDQRIR